MTCTKLHEKYSNYRYCIVRECKNTSIKTPGKMWIRLPSETNKRNNWLRLARRDPESLSTVSQIYFCEDHFDLENDMENYMRYKIMGSVKRIRMKPGCVPSRFESQSDIKRKHSPTPDQLEQTRERHKRSLIMPISEDSNPVCPMEISASSIKQELLDEDDVTPSCSLSLEKAQQKAIQVVCNTQLCDQAVKVQPIHEHVSRQAIQHNAHKVIQDSVKDAASSPIKSVAYCSTATSNKPSKGRNHKPSTCGQSFSRRRMIFTEEKYDSDESFTLSQGGSSTDSPPSEPSSQTTEDSLQEKIVIDEKLNLQSTLSKIKQNPRLYIGIPAELYFIVAMISKNTKLSENNILLCLMKLRLNKTFPQLADDFDISLSHASKIFTNTIPSIYSVLLPFVKNTIKKNLPIAFRYKYNKINCIIHCLEIEIQKPRKALHQTLTWSEYKKANTYKYLIACKLDGLVSFVSSGCGGSISDINLLEHSKFLDSLEPNSVILADGGFKNIEMYLKRTGFTLLRPQSVVVGSKLTESEAKLTKEIASLRVHIERVTRKIREFSILKPHSVVNLNLLNVLDFCVITACALVNLQESMVK